MGNNSRHSARGFTLLEILVAFVILGLASGAIMSIFGSGLIKISDAKNVRLAALSARSVLALIGNEIPIEPGARSGEMPNSVRWSVSISPLDNDPNKDDGDNYTPSIEPYLITVRTSIGSGSNISSAQVTSVRLKAAPRQ